MDVESFLKRPESFRHLIAERLEEGQGDFVEQMQFVKEKRGSGEKHASSGVLLPLEFDLTTGEYTVILNKRSAYVQQAGDLCFPGGGTDRRQDRMLGRLLAWGVLPTKRAGPFRKLLLSSPEERDTLLIILANVLRESWEEMRLAPWRVEYLGCLPALWMQSFPRVIFPMVGEVRAGWRARPNWEVERVLRVPLRTLFDPANYATCRFLIVPTSEEEGQPFDWEYPCLVVNEPGGDEILWGATFRILMTFMERVFEFSLGEISPSRRVHKVLPAEYFTGKGRRGRRKRH